MSNIDMLTRYKDIYLCYIMKPEKGYDKDKAYCLKFIDFVSADKYFHENVGYENVEFSSLIPECRYKSLYLKEISLRRKINKLTHEKLLSVSFIDK